MPIWAVRVRFSLSAVFSGYVLFVVVAIHSHRLAEPLAIRRIEICTSICPRPCLESDVSCIQFSPLPNAACGLGGLHVGFESLRPSFGELSQHARIPASAAAGQRLESYSARQRPLQFA